ncbi:MAG: MFS transporter [Gammaproteobacteria bacterium]|nr:MFS transporter [Gammaproteobacteria bacterium]
MAQNNFSNALRLLKNPNVSRMFVSYLITYMGTAMAPIAMAFGVLDLTGSTADAAFVIAAPTVAAIGVILIGGAIADRTSRQKVIFYAELLAMSAQLSMAFLFLSGLATVPWLTFFMLINGIGIAFNAPASTGLIIQLVDREDLQTVNAILGTARHGAIAIGAALGGLLVAWVGPGMTLLIDGVSFAISAALILSLKPSAQLKEKSESIIQDLKLGWKEFSSHTWLWSIVLQFSLVVAALEAFFGLIGPAFTRDYMAGATHWGFIVSGFGIGTLVGGLFAIKINPRYPMRLAVMMVFAFPLVSLAMLLRSPLEVIVLAAFLVGFCDQIFSVLWYTTLQIKVAPAMMSRVSAYDHIGSIALAPLGLVAAGLLYEGYGYQTTLTATIILVVIPTALVFLVKDVRNMTNEEDSRGGATTRKT